VEAPAREQTGSGLGALNRLTRAVRDLASVRDLDGVVDVVRHAARELVTADGATFVLRQGEQCVYVDEDAIAPLWRGQRFPLDACISGWSMLHHEQVAIPDIYLDDRIPHDAYRPTFVHSLIMTPVRAQDPIAAIGTYWSSNHVASPGELELLQTLADNTAVALESARLLHELELRVDQRTAELAASNHDLAAFAHVAAHDLKSPLATIRSYVTAAEEAYATSQDAAGVDALEAIGRQAARMSSLVDAVLAYSTAATGELAMEHLDFTALVQDVLADISGVVEARGARVEIGPLPHGPGSGPLLERALHNLVVNAVQYGDTDAPVVRVEGFRGPSEVVLRVSDNGAGVPVGERERIFEMFARGTTPHPTSGSGIGLAFARRVIARHGGTLTVGDAAGGGACFTMTLPLEPELV